MFSFIAKWRQSEGLRHSALTISSYALASGFSALAVILISRLLGPTNFADFSVAFSLSLILNRLNDFGLGTVIQKLVGSIYKQANFAPFGLNLSRRQINLNLSLVLKYRLISSVSLVLLGLFFAPWLTTYLKIDNPLLIPLTFVFSVSVTQFELAQITLQSLGQFKLAAYNYFLPALIKFGMAATFFILNIKDTQLILVIYLLSTLPSLLLAEFFKPTWVKYQLEQNFSKANSKVSSLLRHSAFATVSAGIIENMDILFAKHYLSAYETGLLAGVNKIAMLLYVVAYALASVLNPRIAAYRDRTNFDAFLKKAWLIAGAALLTFLLLLPLTPILIEWTIGPAYLAGREILIVLMAAGCLSIAVVPFMSTFYAFRDNRYFSQSAWLQLVIVLVGNLHFVPAFGLIASVYTRLIARSALLLLTWVLLWRNYRREFGKN